MVPGFDPRGVLSFGIAAPDTWYPTVEATEALYQAIGERIRAVPGVRMVAATNAVPLTSNPQRGGLPKPNGDPNPPDSPVNVLLVSPEYRPSPTLPTCRARTRARCG